MRYLEQELQYMNENLVQENFNRYGARLSPPKRKKRHLTIHSASPREIVSPRSSHAQPPDSFVE